MRTAHNIIRRREKLLVAIVDAFDADGGLESVDIDPIIASPRTKRLYSGFTADQRKTRIQTDLNAMAHAGWIHVIRPSGNGDSQDKIGWRVEPRDTGIDSAEEYEKWPVCREFSKQPATWVLAALSLAALGLSIYTLWAAKP